MCVFCFVLMGFVVGFCGFFGFYGASRSSLPSAKSPPQEEDGFSLQLIKNPWSPDPKNSVVRARRLGQTFSKSPTSLLSAFAIGFFSSPTRK